jgi:uncharacterized membrane protein
MTDQTNVDSAHDGSRATAAVDFISAERLIFFSDAVVAIAITLLALALPLPRGLTSASSSHDVFTGMWAERSAYFAFLISFVVIANHWRSHHRLYRNVVQLDSRLVTINMFWLLLIVVTPFATRLISANGGFGARFAIYAIIQVATILAYLAMSRHIRSSHLLRPGAPEPTSKADDAAVLAVAGMFALSIPVALVFETQWAFVIWVASVFAARAVRRGRAPAATLTARFRLR